MNKIKKYVAIVTAVALLCIAALLLLPLISGASPEYEFTRAFLESLRYQKSAFIKHRRLPPLKADIKRLNAAAAPFLENLKAANTDLKQAQSIIMKFKGSGNATLKKTAALVLSLYDKQIQLSEKSLKIYSQVFDPEQMDELGSFTQGKLAAEARKLPEERQNTDRLLMDAAILVTHSLYSNTPDKEGRLNRLTITARERGKLIRQIDEYFSAKVTIPDACAEQIRQALTGKYKSRDQR